MYMLQYKAEKHYQTECYKPENTKYKITIIHIIKEFKVLWAYVFLLKTQGKSLLFIRGVTDISDKHFFKSTNSVKTSNLNSVWNLSFISGRNIKHIKSKLNSLLNTSFHHGNILYNSCQWNFSKKQGFSIRFSAPRTNHGSNTSNINPWLVDRHSTTNINIYIIAIEFCVGIFCKDCE